MARAVVGPWYRQAKGTWYATVDGRSMSLGVKGEGNKREATAQWHRVMVGAADRSPSVPKRRRPGAGGLTVRAIVSQFLADAAERVKPSTLALYTHFLTGFAHQHGGKRVEALTPHDAESYSRKPQWSPSTRHDFLLCVATVMKWAVQARLIAANPVDGLRKPPKTSRGAKAVISEAEYARLLAVAHPAFGVYLQALWLTGCRPAEIANLTAADIDWTTGVAVLYEHKTADKTGKPRVLFFCPAALTLLRRQAKRYPTGPLFPNRKGVEFRRPITIKLMETVREKANVPHATCYGFRHSYATRALAAGIPDAQVAALLGHSGTAMLHRHYSHLTSRADVLRQAAARVR